MYTSSFGFEVDMTPFLSLVVDFVSVEEFFVDSDSIPGQCQPSDEEKP